METYLEKLEKENAELRASAAAFKLALDADESLPFLENYTYKYKVGWREAFAHLRKKFSSSGQQIVEKIKQLEGDLEESIHQTELKEKQNDEIVEENRRKDKKLMWSKVFMLLIARCGASYRMFDDFIRYMMDGESEQKEFRFQGSFGFGGKLYKSNRRVYVGCYPEDSTTEIEITIDQVNSEIEKITQVALSPTKAGEV